MLFKVRYLGDIYTVYSVKQHNTGGYCEFLIYSRNRWMWVYADSCTPIEQ